MSTFLTKILGDKKEWRAMQARANALPRDYRIVYGAVKSYLWRFATGEAPTVPASYVRLQVTGRCPERGLLEAVRLRGGTAGDLVLSP